MMNKHIHHILDKLNDEKNIFITGQRGSGKTTLVKQLLPYLSDFEYIITKKNNDSVILKWRNQHAIIGKKEHGLMRPLSDGFKLGIQGLNFFLNSDQKLLIVDEVGFLERDEHNYISLLIESAKTRQVLFVHRKENHALMHCLEAFKPYFIIDLD